MICFVIKGTCNDFHINITQFINLSISSLAVSTSDSTRNQSRKLFFLPPRIIIQNKDSAFGMWLMVWLMMHQAIRNVHSILNSVSSSVPLAYSLLRKADVT